MPITTRHIRDNTITNADTAADFVNNADIADGAVSLEHLDSAITPSHIPVYAGTHTTAGGGATESITVTGAVATDICMCTLETEGATPVTLDAAASNTNAIDLTFSADPSTDHIVSYILFRAAS